ncbi:unnamed protein product [Linum trigynum]|uniref:Uncharacterized protein n=1 Tax=Linum trigynum TaxID=586398 RepID=A0AAV2E360_9ROSI
MEGEELATEEAEAAFGTERKIQFRFAAVACPMETATSKARKYPPEYPCNFRSVRAILLPASAVGEHDLSVSVAANTNRGSSVRSLRRGFIRRRGRCRGGRKEEEGLGHGLGWF